MNLYVVVIVLLLCLGLAFETFLVQKKWSNSFLNSFCIFNMIFSSPINVMLSVYTLHYLFEYRILSIFGQLNINFYDGITNSVTILLFILLCICINLIVYIVWVLYRGFKISFQSLHDFSKIFIFRAPLLILTFGHFKPSIDAGTDFTVPFLSHLTMMHGLYIVPLFIVLRKIREINYKKNERWSKR
jgi:hypothetical protein